MFGNLFEEDYSSVSNSQYGKGKKLKTKGLEPPAPREFTNLSGIRNQGGTCYLNSLLQTLHFTPEFREALFSLGPEELGSLEDKDKPDAKVRIIPLQLQRLFAQLLLLDQEAASTIDLTDSFGWTSDEEMRQHDVQELNRILFSALETSLVGTSGHDLINRLYHGTIVNQIVCRECKNISEKQEDFLDLTVAVKNVSGLEDALWNMYVEEEVFDCDNLYHCGTCDRLVKAAKSAKLRKLPPFLTISLLRFNFDFVKCERYKETSCYTFPLRINLKPFCEQSEQDDTEYMYDLFSVIIHKGGCYGGHYHVYIKDVDHLGNWQCQFLQLHPQMFLLSTDESTVSLLRNHFTQAPSDLQRHREEVLQTLASEPPGLSDNTSCPHWFDINDSKVQPIKEKAITQQFQGKESAYMLFYRKAKLQRPSEARANPRYRVPGHLLKEMDAANIQLQMRRAECDSANSNFELHLHLGPHYRFFNGALHPAVSPSESVWDLTFDKRKTLGDLRQSIFQLLEFWEGDMVLSVAKRVPAGLHVYHTLHGDELTLCEAEIADGEDIFVWNGVEVGGVQIQTGSDCEPLLLHILHIEMSGEGSKCEQLVESTHVFPSNAEVGTVFTALAIPVGVILTNSVESADEECWTAIPKEDMKKTFREQGLRNGSLILVQDSDNDDNSLLPKQGRWISGVDELNWLQVKNFCQLESEEKQVQIAATKHTVVFDIRIKAIKELKLMKELAENSCLRPIDKNGKLLCPVPDACTLEEAEVKMGSSLGLCLGKAPTSSQLFLFFALGTDIHPGAEMEVIVEETLSVGDCLKIMLEKSGQQGEMWHLRKMDWCYEAGEPLYEEDAILKDLMIRSGDTLLLTEGKLPPPGFLKVPIWWYQPARLSGHCESQDHSICTSSQGSSWGAAPTQGAPGPEPADISLLYLGDVEISEEATLLELKSKAMALPSLLKLAVHSTALLRVWTVENKRPSRLLRTDWWQLKEYRLGRRAELCLELLQKEEDLGPRDVLLRTQLRIPGERAYTLAMDLVWDTTRGWTASSLRQRVADFYSLPVEKIEIAKYFPEKFEWLPISSWNQQVAKRKKKKNQDTLQGGPYYLKDGDTIGIKNLLFDDDDDFSTIRDDIGKENQKQLALGKKKSREVLRAQSSDVFSSAGMPTRPRGPEASLSIHVASFR
ncbi:ubiquitin carboxyl-terminal hydrolase 40 isoform X3 [Phodopus roborovskii]|uniref:ubiquitin carboxyl-terminal hydrolase 40 isoform X3 n=1 Tax=Phodopus roborovskii TaxID=109678 RepID=UPI0021E4F52D|nr:ubiquitin carboxyl-terminal hydrolase 40 isoform X3 [Phodopus roborovskii]